MRWRTRLILWLVAAFSGFVIVVFAKLADSALSLFSLLISGRLWGTFLLTPLVGMLTVWLAQRYFPGTQGSGIPQVIAATRLAAKKNPINHLVSIPIAIGKMLLGTLALVGGFSAGREGPSVQVAASIMREAHRLLPHTRALRLQDMILAGGAAGVAAAFNTPLAGIVFAVEELGRRLETRTSGVLVSAIIISGLVSIATVGNYNYFGHLHLTNLDRSMFFPALAASLTSGLAGGLFSRMMLWPRMGTMASVWRFRKEHSVVFAGLCGVIVAALGYFGGGLSFGSGYATTAQVVSGQLSLPWHAPFSRFLATLISYYSGIPGGIFAPTLAVGAAIGSNLAPYVGMPADTLPIIALCMASFLAATTQAPITSAIIVMEMVDGHQMVISLMAVSLLAKAISYRIGPELYQNLALDFLHMEEEKQNS